MTHYQTEKAVMVKHPDLDSSNELEVSYLEGSDL
jgi:hypothetical protein